MEFYLSSPFWRDFTLNYTLVFLFLDRHTTGSLSLDVPVTILSERPTGPSDHTVLSVPVATLTIINSRLCLPSL